MPLSLTLNKPQSTTRLSQDRTSSNGVGRYDNQQPVEDELIQFDITE